MDAEGNVVGEGDIKLQTKTVLEHVKTVVEEAGGRMDDIVKVTVFMRDMRHYDEIHEVRRRYFEEPYPASSMVEVSALIDPRLLIEIEAVAVVGYRGNSALPKACVGSEGRDRCAKIRLSDELSDHPGGLLRYLERRELAHPL